MAVLVAVETLVLILLSLLVAGLLRSHAEILRRLALRENGRDSTHPEVPTAAERGSEIAADIVGRTLGGGTAKAGVSGGGTSTLLAFLSSGCTSCGPFWKGLAREQRPEVPGGGRIVVVTKDPEYESPSRLRTLAPADLTVLMSSSAWEAYGVDVSPYFVFVDGRGRVRGEGTAESWPQVLSLLEDALGDEEMAAGRRPTGADQELRAAGIGAGHPSLYVPGDPTDDIGVPHPSLYVVPERPEERRGGADDGR